MWFLGQELKGGLVVYRVWYAMICRVCGLESKGDADLILFVKSSNCKSGYQNLCKKCNNERCRVWRKENKEHMKTYYQGWKTANQEHLKQYEEERRKHVCYFKNKILRLEEVSRTNICYLCGKSYPKDLDAQTSLHHILYDESDPVANTIELCNVCHGKLHGKLKP